MKKYERVKQITLPALSFKDRTAAYVRCTGPMCTSDIDESGDGARKRATVMRVVDLNTGEECRLICPSLLVSAFADEGLDYLGKCYEILVTADKLPGKNYKGVEVYEIHDPADIVEDNNQGGATNGKAG